MPSQLLPGRRQLTVLRCALVEEPAWVRRDPEDVSMVLQAFYTTCEEVIPAFAMAASPPSTTARDYSVAWQSSIDRLS